MSKNALELTINKAINNTFYEKRLSEALSKSREDYKNGRFYSSRESMMEAVKLKRKASW